MTGDERTLVAGCLRDDPSACRRFIDLFEPEIMRFCYRMLDHRQDAEDCTQEIFVRIFRALSRWDAERPLRPWLMTIAANRCKTYLSARKRRPELVEHLETTLGREDDDSSRELIDALQEALQELRPEFRMAFVLFHDHGRSYEEIGETLDRPVGTIKTWLHRTRQELFTKLSARGLLDDPPLQPRATL